MPAKAKKIKVVIPKIETAHRRFIGTHKEIFPLPNLIEVQTKSYKWFFDEGLKELLEELSPIHDFTGKNLELHLLNYYLDQPKMTEAEARDRNLTYKAPLRLKTRLINKVTNEKKDQEVFFGDFPLMTDQGTFIINGVERVVVSQLVRSSGVLFTVEASAGEKYYGAKIIPNRGAWLEIETSAKNVIAVKIDRKRKIPITTLLRAFGLNSNEEIEELFKGVNDNPEKDFIKNTSERDPSHSTEQAMVEIYKRIRPGDLATSENARSLIESMFFDPRRYDLGRVGRYKVNSRLGLKYGYSKEDRILHQDDVVEIIKEVIRLNNGKSIPDDIDHLNNRRVRAVGELVQNRVRVGLLRMERIVKDRMSVSDIKIVAAGGLINVRPIVASLQEFFASSQLSQFMDQTNPLAELEHKRRLSAMGPGGLSRERASFEVRDVHTSHYGRICPIETPEGPNVGLVGHLASYARVNDFGFIETPYRKVKKDASGRSRVTDEVIYLDAHAEDKATIVQANAKIDEKGYFLEEKVSVRKFGKPEVVSPQNVDYIDVSPKQIVAIATGLIPFVEHDDASRALMGANMLRQAVSLIKPSSPVVGTGLEEIAARGSGHVIVCEEDGEVTFVDASKIVVTTHKGKKYEYKLLKFFRSNQGTCINQRPLVHKGMPVKKGSILGDGSSTELGEIALGQNVLVAFMPWGGANFEDAIIISSRMVRDDIFTSVHIEKHSIDVRDTKLGSEIVTRDIPNVGEEALRNLDEEGIVRIGAIVSEGDILVGKISPKGETELSAEERLLRAIFGEKASDVKDTSLRLPHGEYGKVVSVKIFSRDAGDELTAGVIKQIQVMVAQMRKVSVGDKMAGRHGNKGVVSKILPMEDMPHLADGTPVDIILNPLGVISRMNIGQILETHLGWAAQKLGYKVATPVFEGVSIDEIKQELAKAGFATDGKEQLYDGRTGKIFDNRVTVGIIYMMKLIHLVDDKVHARSIGPYSMITQQPLGGKAQFGGQRFGEMEVWALEAYGAAHTLQEMLTIKSDDVSGRVSAYQSIIKGTEIERPSIPESFFVLVRELQSLCLGVDLLMDKEKPKEEAKSKKRIERGEKQEVGSRK